VKRKWSYTVEQIAAKAGVPRSTAKRHRRFGMLDPNDLGVVATYITAQRALKRLKDKRKEKAAQVDEATQQEDDYVL
jgi:hypothetical protein